MASLQTCNMPGQNIVMKAVAHMSAQLTFCQEARFLLETLSFQSFVESLSKVSGIQCCSAAGLFRSHLLQCMADRFSGMSQVA